MAAQPRIPSTPTPAVPATTEEMPQTEGMLFSETAGAQSDFLQPDDILGIPFWCHSATPKEGKFGKSYILEIHFDNDPETYSVSNSGAYFTRQLDRIVKHNQFPFRACLERKQDGQAGPNGQKPLILADPRSKRNLPDAEWLPLIEA